MKRSTATLLTNAALFIGGAIGAFAGYRYAEHQFSYYLLTSTHEQARSGIATWSTLSLIATANVGHARDSRKPARA